MLQAFIYLIFVILCACGFFLVFLCLIFHRYALLLPSLLQISFSSVCLVKSFRFFYSSTRRCNMYCNWWVMVLSCILYHRECLLLTRAILLSALPRKTQGEEYIFCYPDLLDTGCLESISLDAKHSNTGLGHLNWTLHSKTKLFWANRRYAQTNCILLWTSFNNTLNFVLVNKEYPICTYPFQL